MRQNLSNSESKLKGWTGKHWQLLFVRDSLDGGHQDPIKQRPIQGRLFFLRFDTFSAGGLVGRPAFPTGSSPGVNARYIREMACW